MAAKLIIAPEAEQDIAEAYGWYEERRTGLGEEFLDCVDACIHAIARLPEMHAPVYETTGVRSCGDFRTRSSTKPSMRRLPSTASSKPEKWRQRRR
jgi:hypothetical protein